MVKEERGGERSAVVGRRDRKNASGHHKKRTRKIKKKREGLKRTSMVEARG